MLRLGTDQKRLISYPTWGSVGITLIFLQAICLPMTWAEEPTPEFLIRQVINTYRSLDTYQVNGQTDWDHTDFKEGGKVSHQTNRFTILLKKPNGYHITWKKAFSPLKMPSQGAVWKTGPQAYGYNQTEKGLMPNGYMMLPTDLGNLMGHSGASMGATEIIPALFFTFFSEKDLRISRLKNPIIVKGREEINGDLCYVLKGESYGNRVLTYWISVDNFRGWRRKS